MGLSTANTGSLFIASGCSAALVPIDHCLFTPSSYDTAYSKASSGFAKGSTHNLSLTFLLFKFKMNTSCTRVWVMSPISHLAANPFKACQNCCRDSVGNCFRDRKWCLSSVLFLSIRKRLSQFCSISVACKDQLDVSGYLLRNIFRPVSPNYRNIMLTTFLFAVSSAISPRSDFTLGLGFPSSTVLVNSFIDMEYFAILATANRSLHFSHSIDCDFEASCQNRDNPTNT